MMIRLPFVPDPLPSAATVAAAAALIAAIAASFYYAEPTPSSLAAGLALIVLGIGMRLATNSVLKKNQEICREGLYAFCRHPMYLGTLAAAAGIAVALNHPAALVLLVAAVAISLYRIRREEDFLKANLSNYEDYRRETPAFPTPASVLRGLRSGRARARLSLTQLFLNGEVLRLNLYLALLLVSSLYLKIPETGIVVGAVLSLLLAAASMYLHPPDAPRSRFDYLLPGVLATAILVVAFM